MTSKQKYAVTLGFILVVLAFLLVDIFYFNLLLDSPSLGLDLQGGVSVVLTAKEKKGAPVTEKTMEQALFVLQQRVDGLGVTEPVVERQGRRNILVQLPGIKDPDRALEVIGKTAVLEFKAVISSQGGKTILGPTLMTGGIKDAKVGFDQMGKSKVDFTLDKKGAKEFDKVAKEYYQKQVAIVLDGKVMSAPTIQATEFRGKGEITGDFSPDEAEKIALVLKTGSLPVELKREESRTVGPTLGRDSLKEGLNAGIIGLILVALFMVIFYRAFGLITCFSLTIFAGLLYSLLAAVGATLTLPGIAGIILMIGVAADSSIIIFERIKEEVRGGKTMRTAMETGYSLGFQTFLDADLVTFVTAAVLFLIGIGPVKGFALTLMLGIGCDLFISFFFVRSVLGLASYVESLRKPFLLGAKLKEAD